MSAGGRFPAVDKFCWARVACDLYTIAQCDGANWEDYRPLLMMAATSVSLWQVPGC